MKYVQNEYEAISLLKEGNLSGFNFLYYKYNRVVYTNILKFIKNQTTAEDILQDVFLTLWEKRTSLKTNILVGGWLFTISYNKSIAFLKKQLKESVSLIDAKILLNPPTLSYENERINYEEMITLLEDAVNQLPLKKQKVFRLYKLENKNVKEISQELGLTVISVKGYLKQSSKQIKQYVKVKYAAEMSFLIFFMSIDTLFTSL